MAEALRLKEWEAVGLRNDVETARRTEEEEKAELLGRLRTLEASAEEMESALERQAAQTEMLEQEAKRQCQEEIEEVAAARAVAEEAKLLGTVL